MNSALTTWWSLREQDQKVIHICNVQKYIGYSNRLIVSIAGTAESSHEQHWNHLAMPLKVTQQVSGIMQMCNHCCTHSNWTFSPIRSMNFHMQMCRNLKGRGTVMIQPKGIKSLIPVGSWLSVATYWRRLKNLFQISTCWNRWRSWWETKSASQASRIREENRKDNSEVQEPYRVSIESQLKNLVIIKECLH